jgi:osmotically-inducible protein OsmY
MQKSGHIALALGMMLSVSGCASFVAQVTGTTPIGTDSGVRSFPQALTDDSIERTANVNMYKLDKRFKYSRININSFFGAVLLTGQVADQNLKQLAGDNIKAMTDAKNVHNYIDVGDQIGYSTIMQDGIITANIRRQLLVTQGISDSKVKVVVENGVVYVMGKLTQSENQILNNILQNTPNITRVVPLIDLLNDNGTPTGNNGLTGGSGNASINSGLGGAVAKPLVDTPVAIDPEQASPDHQGITTKVLKESAAP